jgi:type III pantothenate kinase
MSNLLAVDIGNTHTVAGVFTHDRLIAQWRIKSDGERPAAELAVIYHNLFNLSAIDAKLFSGAIVASVVPPLDTVYKECMQSLFGGQHQFSSLNVTADSVAGLIEVDLENPAEVGADRLVNGISAYTRCAKNVIIIDFGTAITFDCIAAGCRYLGGLIIPGLSLALDSLTQRAAKLPKVDFSTPPTEFIGRSTVSAMKSGVLHGYGTMIAGLIEQLKAEMHNRDNLTPVVYATGGMASILKPYVAAIDEVVPDLTLEGLQIIYQRLTN